MTLNSYLEISTNKFELFHIIRKFLTNVFVYKDANIKRFIDTNNIPDKYHSATTELLTEYDNNYNELENQVSLKEIKLIEKRLSEKKKKNTDLNESTYDMIFIYAEDSKKYVSESIKEFLSKYKVFQDCLTKTNFSYHNRYHFENFILKDASLIVIIFSKELNSYWNSLKFNEVLIENEKKIKESLYLFNVGDSYIPNILRTHFNILKNDPNKAVGFPAKMVSSSHFIDFSKKETK